MGLCLEGGITPKLKGAVDEEAVRGRWGERIGRGGIDGSVVMTRGERVSFVGDAIRVGGASTTVVFKVVSAEASGGSNGPRSRILNKSRNSR